MARRITPDPQSSSNSMFVISNFRDQFFLNTLFRSYVRPCGWRRPLPRSCYCADHSQLSPALSDINSGYLPSCVMQRSSSSNIYAFLCFEIFLYFIKNKFLCCLRFFWLFYVSITGSPSNQRGVLHLKWYPMFVRLHHEHRDYA